MHQHTHDGSTRRRGEGKWSRKKIEDIVGENFQNIVKNSLHLQKLPRSTPRHIIVKMLKAKGKIMGAEREKNDSSCIS